MRAQALVHVRVVFGGLNRLLDVKRVKTQLFSILAHDIRWQLPTLLVEHHHGYGVVLGW